MKNFIVIAIQKTGPEIRFLSGEEIIKNRESLRDAAIIDGVVLKSFTGKLQTRNIGDINEGASRTKT